MSEVKIKKTVLGTSELEWRPMGEAPRNQPVLLKFDSRERIEGDRRIVTVYQTSVACLRRDEDGRWQWYLKVDPFLTGGEAVQPRVLVSPSAWARIPHFSTEKQKAPQRDA